MDYLDVARGGTSDQIACRAGIHGLIRNGRVVGFAGEERERDVVAAEGQAGLHG